MCKNKIITQMLTFCNGVLLVESKIIIFVIVFFRDSYSRQIAFNVFNIKFEDLQSNLLGTIPQNLRIQHCIV